MSPSCFGMAGIAPRRKKFTRRAHPSVVVVFYLIPAHPQHAHSHTPTHTATRAFPQPPVNLRLVGPVEWYSLPTGQLFRDRHGYMIVVLDTGHVWDQGSVNFMPYVGEYTGAADIWAPTLRHA